MTRYNCGCVNEIDPVCFAQFNVSKCRFHQGHQREVGELGPDYYAEMGSSPEQRTQKELQFLDGFGEPVVNGASSAILEIGGGASLYVPLLQRSGWQYFGLEPSLYAAEWVKTTYGVSVERSRLGDASLLPGSYGAVLSAHSLEHMSDPRRALTQMLDCLVSGGTLYLLIPDDTDLWNPDHLWFFSPATIRRLLGQVGFQIQTLNLRRHTNIENYIYITARKP